MRSCYVSIPFGVKVGPHGTTHDFDHLYSAVLKPAITELGVECRRLDELATGGMWHKALFTALLSSELVVADVSTHSPNVLYELGVRHALRRGRTLLISAQGRLPVNVSYTQALWYELDGAGRLTDAHATRFRSELQAAIRNSQRSVISDSPIYEFFPDLHVELPAELSTDARACRTPTNAARQGFVQSVVESPSRALGALQQNEVDVRSAGSADPVEYLKLMRKYRDVSEWDRVIALADDAPPPLASVPELQQLLALALNRRGKSGDQERAIELMDRLVKESGGDSETFGILGRIYKDRYARAKEQDDGGAAAVNLERALHYYRLGFEKNPKDYYPGINVVGLLLQRGDEAARSELAQIVPRVRSAVQERREAGRLDYWDLTAELQLATVERDWSAARHVAELAASSAPSDWMLETTMRSLQQAEAHMSDATDRGRMAEIRRILQPNAGAESAS
jgi:hypothetical protein